MIWVRIATLVFSTASLVIVCLSSRRINRTLAEVERLNRPDLGAQYYDKMTRPRPELTDKDEMLLRHLTRDPRRPFDGSWDDE